MWSLPRALGAAAGVTRLGPLLVLQGAVLAVSTSAILIRFTTAPPLLTATVRMLVAASILLAVAACCRRTELRNLERRDVLLMAASGFALGVHFALWTTGLFWTSVASAVLLVDTHPVFVALLAVTVLREPPPRAVWIGIALTMAGSALIASGDLQVGGRALIGDVMVLGASATVAVYLVIGRRVRQRLGLATYAGLVYGIAGVSLLLMSLVIGVPLTDFGAHDAAAWAGLVVLPTLAGHTVINWSLKHVAAPVVGVSLLGEPVLTTLLAWLVLSEEPPLMVLPGGALILVGLFMALRAGARH